jgi:hypothetical protein
MQAARVDLANVTLDRSMDDEMHAKLERQWNGRDELAENRRITRLHISRTDEPILSYHDASGYGLIE